MGISLIGLGNGMAAGMQGYQEGLAFKKRQEREDEDAKDRADMRSRLKKFDEQNDSNAAHQARAYYDGFQRMKDSASYRGDLHSAFNQAVEHVDSAFKQTDFGNTQLQQQPMGYNDPAMQANNQAKETQLKLNTSLPNASYGPGASGPAEGSPSEPEPDGDVDDATAVGGPMGGKLGLGSGKKPHMTVTTAGPRMGLQRPPAPQPITGAIPGQVAQPNTGAVNPSLPGKSANQLYTFTGMNNLDQISSEYDSVRSGAWKAMEEINQKYPMGSKEWVREVNAHRAAWGDQLAKAQEQMLSVPQKIAEAHGLATMKQISSAIAGGDLKTAYGILKDINPSLAGMIFDGKRAAEYSKDGKEIILSNGRKMPVEVFTTLAGTGDVTKAMEMMSKLNVKETPTTTIKLGDGGSKTQKRDLYDLLREKRQLEAKLEKAKPEAKASIQREMDDLDAVVKEHRKEANKGDREREKDERKESRPASAAQIKAWATPPKNGKAPVYASKEEARQALAKAFPYNDAEQLEPAIDLMQIEKPGGKSKEPIKLQKVAEKPAQGGGNKHLRN